MQYSSADENSTSDSLPTRRDAIKVLSAVAASALTGGGLAAGARNDDIPADATHFFTPEEVRLVEAVSEQIIPADKDPGARDARVVLFIDRQLVGPYAQHQAAYRAVFAPCRRHAAGSSASLSKLWVGTTKRKSWPRLKRDGLPKELWKSPTCTEFFNLVLEHTKQGFYGSPQNGGNYNYVSYQMLGLDHDYYPLPIRNSGGKP